MEGQIGLEPKLETYIEKLLKVTKELYRVLKKTGVMFWNHGDCYGGNNSRASFGGRAGFGTPREGVFKIPVRQKCLALQNWRLILKMIDEQGWVLRNSIVWSKSNAMPSSVRDRFSNSWEPVFMLVKNKKYWFDLDSIRIPSKTKVNIEQPGMEQGNQTIGLLDGSARIRSFMDNKPKTSILQLQAESFESSKARYLRNKYTSDYIAPIGPSMGICKERQEWCSRTLIGQMFLGKNPGDVWQISTQPCPKEFRSVHFAGFPEKLIEPMILAGCPKEVCKKCGKARERKSKRIGSYDYFERGNYTKSQLRMKEPPKGWRPISRKTIGWTDCGCNAGFEPGIVLDPFMGLGTVGVVAKKLGRNWVGIDISERYCKTAEERIKNAPTPLF